MRVEEAGALGPIEHPGPVEIVVGGGVTFLRLGEVRASSLRISADGPGTTLQLAGPLATDGDLAIDVVGRIEFDTAERVESQFEVTTMDSGGDLRVLAGDALVLRDAPDRALRVRSKGRLELEGRKLLDVYALDSPNSLIASGGDLVLRSAAPVVGDAHWVSGGDVLIEDLAGLPGELVSPHDPVVLSTRNVSLGAYNGASLHILAGGSVTLGNVTISTADAAGNSISAANGATFNGSDTFASLGAVTLSNGTPVAIDGAARPTLDVRAGIDWSTFAGGAPSPDDQVIPLASISPSISGPATTPSISIGTIAVTSPGGMVLLTNRYRPNGVAGGAITTSTIQTSTNTPGANGGFILLDSRSNLATGNLYSYSFTPAPAALAGDGGRVIALAAADLSCGSVATDSNSDTGAAGSGGAVTIRAGGRLLSTPNVNTRAISDTGSGNGGDVSIEATGPMTVGQILTASRFEVSGSSGNAGDVTIVARSSGAVDGGEPLTVDFVWSDSGAWYSSAAVGASGDGGDLELRSEDGDVTVTQWLWAQTHARGGAFTSGRGGDVAVTAVNGDLSVGSFAVNARSLATGGTGATGRGGNVTLVADGGISVNPAISNGGINTSTQADGGAAGHGGNVVLDARSGAIDLGTINGLFTDVNGNAGTSSSGGSITLTATGPVVAQGLDASASGGSGGSAGNGGAVKVTAGGDFTLSSNISTWSVANGAATGSGGPVTVFAAGQLVGTPTILSLAQASTTAGNGGDVSITAVGPLAFGTVQTHSRFTDTGSSGNGGDVSITASSTGATDGAETMSLQLIYTYTGTYYSAAAAGPAGDAGDVMLRTFDGDISVTQWIWSHSQARTGSFSTGRGGDVQVIAGNGDIAIGEFGINTRAWAAGASTGGTGRGGNVSLMADGSITINNAATNGGVITSTTSDDGSTGPSGSVLLSAAGGGIDFGSNGIETDVDGDLGVAGDAGGVTLAAAGPITLAFVDTSSTGRVAGSAGHGGAISISTPAGLMFTGGADLLSYSLSDDASSGNGGNITLTVGGTTTALDAVLAYSASDTGSGDGGAIAIDTAGPFAAGLVDSYSQNRLNGPAGNGGTISITVRDTGALDGTQGATVNRLLSESGCWFFGATCSAGSAGDVTVLVEDGDFATTNYIYTHAIGRGAPSSAGHGGDLGITASNGTITIGNAGIATRTDVAGGTTGNTGTGGDVRLTARGDITIATGGIDASSNSVDGDAAGGGLVDIVSDEGSFDLFGSKIYTYATSSTGASGPGGPVDVSVGPTGAINMGPVSSRTQSATGPSAGAGGSVSLSGGGVLMMGLIDSFSRAIDGVSSAGGDVTISMGGAVTVTSVATFSYGETASAPAGHVSVEATGPTTLGAVLGYSITDGAGDAAASADVTVVVHDSGAFDGGDGLTIDRIDVTTGNWYFGGAVGSGADAGAIDLSTEDGDIEIGADVRAWSAGRGGSSSCGNASTVQMTAANGGISIGDGGINATSIIGSGATGTAGFGGAIRLVADHDVVFPSTTSSVGPWVTCTADDGTATGAGTIEVRSLQGAVDLGITFAQARVDAPRGTAGPGGSVILNAATTLTAGLIDVSSSATESGSAGPAGYVDIRAGSDVVLDRIHGTSIGAVGSSNGGLFVVDTQGTLRLTGGAASDPTIDASGNPGTGWVVLSHGGGAGTPFTVGDASANGTAFDIVSTDATLSPTVPYPVSHFEAPSIWIVGDEPAVLVNELDVDQPGVDTAEFIELYNPFPDPMTLELVRVEVVDGTGPDAVVLHELVPPGVEIPAHGYWTICPTGSTAAVCDQFQDFGLPDAGPAAVAVRLTGILEDTVSYGGDTPGGYTEGTGVGLEDSDTLSLRSLSRVPDATDTDSNATDFGLHCVSPGIANLAATGGCTATGAAVLTSVSAAPATVDEGSNVTVSGAFTEPPPAAGHVVVVDWGDGTVSNLPLSAGTTVFDAVHAFADDEAGTKALRAIHVTVSDGVSTDEAWTSVAVENVAPSVEAGANLTAGVGESVGFSGGYTDPGSADTHTLTWLFGDGATSTGSLTPNHSYAAPGLYTVTLEVLDDDLGLGSDTLTVDVADVSPTVLGISTVATTPGGLVDGTRTRGPTTRLAATYSADMVNPGGSASNPDVSNPSNYRLIGAGADDVLSTFGCAAAVGDDQLLPMDPVVYDQPSRTAVFRPLGGASLEIGRWRLVLCASGLENIFGSALDGDGDGVGGDDLQIDFEVSREELVVNPNFDLGLSGWTASTPPGSPFIHDPATDGEGSPWSGSATADNAGGAGAVFELSQCVTLPVSTEPGLELRALVRMDPGAVDGSVAGAELEFFSGGSCGGASLGLEGASPVYGSTGGQFLPVRWVGFQPPGAASVRVVLFADADAGAPSEFSAWFDRASLESEGVVFVDGFESGSTSAWSAAVP